RRRARRDPRDRARAPRPAARAGGAVTAAAWLRGRPHVHAAALCLGIAAANAARTPGVPTLIVASLVAGAAVGLAGDARVAAAAVAVALLGWCWGSARLDALDQSPLAA